MKVSIIGQGYVGLPLAIAIVEAGHQVVGIDLDTQLIKKLESGISTIHDLADSQIKCVLNTGRYELANSFQSVATSEIVILCVPTPLDNMQKPDTSFLVSAVTSVAAHLKIGSLVINESTVSPGTTRGLIKKILDTANVDYDLVYSPERIDPSNKKWNITNTPKLISGLTLSSTKRAESFYKTFVETVKIGTSPEVVETAKLLENSFRLINISFINEFAQFCSGLKIDVREVIDAAATKPYGYMPFYPGVGIGGHCIPVDPSYLVSKAEEIGSPTRFINLANDINRSMATYFAGVASEILSGLERKKILIVGIAYKPNVADTRETPAADLINKLRSKGADVAWHDDLVRDWNGEKSVPLSSNYDLIILANPHSTTNLSLLGSAKVLDTSGGY